MKLEAVIAERLIYWAHEITEQVIAKWQLQDAVDGNKEIAAEDIVLTTDTVMVELVARGDAAWITEFGSGHLMETSLEQNPYLQDYLSSDRYNPARAAEGNEFLGRQQGDTVYCPDGSTYTSSGKAPGMHLEHDFGRQGAYKAQLPLHTIRTEIEATWPLIIEDISNVIVSGVSADITDNFSFNLYI